jgi:hypothetical protein
MFITQEAGVTGRGRNTGWWAGIANLFWWCDREKGVCGFIASQVMPFGDPHVENLLRIRLIATSHVFECVGMFRVKVKPIGVNGMVSSFSSCPQKRPAACETTAIPARASRIRPRPAFTTTHSRALVPIYFDIISSLPLFQTDQFSLATAPIINNNRAHTATALNHPHNHVYRRLPESGLGRGV